MPAVKYKRVLLKLSGEAFAGKSSFGIDPPPSYASPGK
jgi:uridylate kinase